MQNETELAQLVQTVDRQGVYVEKEIHGSPFQGIEMVVPHVVLVLCTRGSGRAMYDRQKVNVTPNTLAVILPGHILQPLDFSDDYTYTRIAVSKELYEDLSTHIFNRGYEKFHTSPACHLTDLHVKRIMALAELIEAIASHDINDLQFRREMLLAQLAIAYEIINYYRREQELQEKLTRASTVFSQFCELVVAHHKENRNVNYYAELLGYDPRYFSKLFRQLSNDIAPLDWIQQYVATQARRIMDEHPRQTVKETARELGFASTSGFCRYFKRATGIYPQAYKQGTK